MHAASLIPAAAALLALSAAPSFRQFEQSKAPQALRAPMAKGNAAIGTLKQTLVARLTAEVAKNGPVSAIDVCRLEAAQLTDAAAKDSGLRVGRTSHRLRNPKNQPPAWAAATVTASAGKKAAEVQPLVFDLGKQVGVLQPLEVGAQCLACHGPRETLAPAVQQAVTRAYPEDQATGFAVGDLRGWAWAEVPKSAR